jgi:hypothetical protein
MERQIEQAYLKCQSILVWNNGCTKDSPIPFQADDVSSTLGSQAGSLAASFLASLVEASTAAGVVVRAPRWPHPTGVRAALRTRDNGEVQR